MGGADKRGQGAPRGRSGSGVSRRRTASLVVAVFCLEALLIATALLFVGNEPESTFGRGLATEAVEDPDRVVEIPVLDARLPNARTGVTYLYDTEIYVQVRAAHEARVRREIDQFANEIRAELISIWKTSEPHHFNEPHLETLNHRVMALLGKRFARTPDGETVVRKVVIVMNPGYRLD